MNVLISGGAKNGKSMYAQRMAKAMAEKDGRPLYYIATMIPCDREDEARIRRHRQERAGWGFVTLERGRDLCGLFAPGRETETGAAEPAADSGTEGESAAGAAVLRGGAVDPAGIFLLDSVTALLDNEMFAADGSCDIDAWARVAGDCVRFAKATGNTIFVSDYIYADAAEYGELTEAYRKGLAMIDRRLAKECDRVVEVSAGGAEEWKAFPADGAEDRKEAPGETGADRGKTGADGR